MAEFDPAIFMDIPEDFENHQHVMPLTEDHIPSPECWCEPTCIADFRDDGGSQLFVHHRIH